MLLFSSRHGWEGWAASFASTVYTSVPFHFSPASPPNPVLPFQSFPFPRNSVSIIPRNQVPSCLCSSAQFVCRLSLCKCVYWLSFLLHITIPVLSVVHSTHIQTPALPRSCLSSGMDNPPPSYSFSRGQRLRHARLYKHWFIPPVRLQSNAIRFTDVSDEG